MNIEERLIELETQFRGRLSADLLQYSMEYIGHGEYRLALETLCDYLCEEDVLLSESEFSNLLQLGGLLGSDMMSNRYAYLKNLILPTENPRPPHLPT
ncbi:MAG: MafI family immunity protein [Hydrogenophaga sp.]|uniref:MafI family immunity protein n=1 Tax=Hydrogenophaga sp. TaxID=1904254 RepID=UPI001A60AF0D|nr:MafI family immunity protein [Hydrogenophaga sp.]